MSGIDLDGPGSNPELFRLLVESVEEYAIFMLGPEGHVVTWNAGAQRIKGYEAQEIVGQHYSVFYDPEDVGRGKPDWQLRVAAAEGRVEDEGWRVRKDGSRFLANVVITALCDADGAPQGYAKVTRDITQRRVLDDQLRHAQKMDAIGRVTAGVAHDFNNLLTVIAGFTDLVARGVSDDPALRAHVAEVARAAERAAVLTQQLLVFSRKNDRRVTTLDVNQVVGSMEPILERILAERLDVRVQVRPKPTLVSADRGELEQIILNLAVNARDAMPLGGTLTVATRLAELAAPEADRLGIDPGGYAALTVTDTGTGIEAAHLGRLFEPYFTTKPEGEGTGLGLATCYAIAADSGGAISIDTELGRGTTVTVFLPVAEQTVSSRRDLGPGLTPTDLPALLLVEDDGDVRAVARLILEEAGYAVLEARYGEEALWVAERADRPIDLVVTDGVLPGMNGRELATRLSKLMPVPRVLYMSGHQPGEHGREPLLPGDVFLAKPFTPESLLAKVAEAMKSS